MKKRFMSLFLAVVMAVGMVSSGFAAAPVNEILYGSATKLGEEITPYGTVETYNIVVPADGSWVEVSEFRGEYQNGDRITVSSLWEPSYASLALEFYADDGTATMGFMRSGEKNQFNLKSSSMWNLRVRAAEGTGAEGSLQITIS